MLQNYDIDITDFLQLTASGLNVASFVQIKAALIRRYKEAYGDDIDVSTNTADGVFVNNLALIINNILQTVLTMYNNLDVNTASGKYLDILCNLSNVTRKQAISSYASITVKNVSDNTIILNDVEFIDKAGMTWASNETNVEINANEEIDLTVYATELGPISAPAGYIDKVIDNTLPITIEQKNAAIIGSFEETDSQLRARRSQYGSSNGVTVLESLASALLNNVSIKDVKIYNNASSLSSTEPLDGTTIPAHNVYIILRKAYGILLNNATIGSIIYSKLTPGISSTVSNDTNANRQYNYSPSVIGYAGIDYISQPVYWKEAKPVAKPLTISITASNFFDANLTNNKYGTLEIIANSVMNYLNELQIGKTPSLFELQSVIINADPKFKSMNTYIFNDCKINNTLYNENDFSNEDNYYNYTNVVYKQSGNTYTITIS